MGTVTPASETWRAISGTAAAAASLFTVTRTSWDPARASATTCAAVPAASAVSVLVIDWTTTGAAEPTCTPPIQVLTVRRRFACAIVALSSSRQTPKDTPRPPREAVGGVVLLDHAFRRYYFGRRLK